MQIELLNDNDILIEIRSGNKNAYQHVFYTYYKYLVNFAFKMLHEKEASEEIVQDVFFNLWDKHETIEIHTSLKAYLFRSVQNRCINQVKHIEIREKYKEYNQEQNQFSSEGVEEKVAATELSMHIKNAVSQLPPERKRIFEMSRNDGLKNREIAEKLNLSIKTVENQMGRALKFLRTELVDFLPILIFILIMFEKNK